MNFPLPAQPPTHPLTLTGYPMRAIPSLPYCWILIFLVQQFVFAPTALARQVQVQSESRFIGQFLNRYCAKCHGQKEPKAEFAVHNLDPEAEFGKNIERWEKITEMVELKHMPPDHSKQPTTDERKKVTDWIGMKLTEIGRGPSSDKLELPSQGNRVDHQALFSGNHRGPAYTPSRRWRKSPHIYHRFANEMRVQISQPLQGLGGKGIQDYSNLMADEATIQTMLRNCNLIADRLIKVERAPLNHLFKPESNPDKEEISRAIERLFQMIFQRSPTADDQQKYVRLFEKNHDLAGLEIGMRSLIVGMLMSQEFVFRMEIGLGEQLPDGRRWLSPMEIAYAVSFAFFDKPERSLIDAARNGKLKTRADVEREVRRILSLVDDEKRYWNYPMYHMWGRDYYQHQPRVLRFFQEYFGYAAAPDIFKDRERNPDHHANRLRKDADFLVLTILDHDQNVLSELLTTNRYPLDPLRNNQIESALKDPNNRFYKGLRSRFGDRDFESILKQGIWPGVQSQHVSAYNLEGARKENVRRRPGEPVEFPEQERAGMLTHPAWLVAHSGNFDNDPIRRGKWIREKLLAELIPDVPIGVDAKVPEDPHRTLRERLDVVRPAECWRCHRLMNPLGEPFEAYDDFGQYRTKIVLGDADGYRKAKRKYEHDLRRANEELKRWQELDANARAQKASEAREQLDGLAPPDKNEKNFPAQLRRYENDRKRWNNEFEKWSQMDDEQQQREVQRWQKRIADLSPPVAESKPVDASGELRGTGDPELDGPVTDAIDLVHRLAKSERVRQSFIRHAFRYWMGRNETLHDSPTMMDADRAYVKHGGSFKELLVALLTSDSFLLRKDFSDSNQKSHLPPARSN